MKVVILAGGFGTRISEESSVRPKPLVEIGGRPILWHIMKIYSAYGLNDFVICCGYKGEMIKQYFRDYAWLKADLTFDLGEGQMTMHRNDIEPWKVTLVDTGEDTMTGGRIRRAREYFDGGTFCMTYGDGLADIDIRALVAFHRESGAAATVTAVMPPGRFGSLRLVANEPRVAGFREKSSDDSGFINGGFFVLEPEAIELIDGDNTVWEREPLENLAGAGRLAAFRHQGFWQNMDTIRDRQVLEDLWSGGAPPWKTW